VQVLSCFCQSQRDRVGKEYSQQRRRQNHLRCSTRTTRKSSFELQRQEDKRTKSTTSWLAPKDFRVIKPVSKLSRNESKSGSEKLPNAKTPVLLSSSRKNCATFLLPLTGDVGVRCGGRTTSLKGEVSSMTLIRSLGVSGEERAGFCWNRATGLS